jgi:hypothetical protein
MNQTLGFTAEASLYPRHQHYPGIGSASVAKGGIHPALRNASCFYDCMGTWADGCMGFESDSEFVRCYNYGESWCDNRCQYPWWYFW